MPSLKGPVLMPLFEHPVFLPLALPCPLGDAEERRGGVHAGKDLRQSDGNAD